MQRWNNVLLISLLLEKRKREMRPAAKSRLGSLLTSSSHIVQLFPASKAATGNTFHVHNPSNGDVLATVRETDSPENVMQRCSDEMRTFRKTPVTERAELLKNYSRKISENSQELAEIITLESGKPMRESLGEIGYATSFLDFYGNNELRPKDREIKNPFPDSRSLTVKKQSVGLSAFITPWNFPISMITRKIAPAIMMGGTCVLKPSELTPLVAIALEKLAFDSGIPQDVFRLVLAGTKSTPSIGKLFCEDRRVKKISFTGSTSVGKTLLRWSSTSPIVKRFSLELGGNAVFIVCESADVDSAVDGAINSKFRNAGQTCVCSDRFLIHEKVADEFEEKLLARVQKIRVKDGFERGCDMSCLITSESVDKIEFRVNSAVANGAVVLIGGERLPDLGENYFSPTVIAGVSLDDEIWRSENFGPVIALRRFSDIDEAINTANDSDAGLCNYFYSRDQGEIEAVADSLESGMVGINCGIISNCHAPFGGVGGSGLGREGGVEGYDSYVETKYLCSSNF